MPSKEKEMNFIEELQWRGLVKDVTDFDGLTEKTGSWHFLKKILEDGRIN